MKRNIIAGAVIIWLCLFSTSCNDTTDDHTGKDITDTMTMPAASPEHVDTPVAPPAVVDTAVGQQRKAPDSIPAP